MLVRLGKSLHKTVVTRVVHAVFFELGLLCALVPFIAWYLGVSVWQAFVMDAALAGFYMVYAFAFNWAYDVIFPIPAHDAGAQSRRQRPTATPRPGS